MPIKSRADRTHAGLLSNPFAQGALLALACLLVYLPALRAGFIWDDDVLITRNPLVLSAGGLAGIWCGEVNPDYLPLTSSLFWLEDRLWGLNPAGFHAVNILLHAGAVILLWRVLLRLRLPLAWFTALLFAVHPVAVATVAWVAEGKSTLAMVLALAALLEYLRWRDGAARHGYRLALGRFLLALLAKSAVVMLPPVLLMCDWWRARRLTRADLLRSAPFFVLSAIFAVVTIWFQGQRAIAHAHIEIGGPFIRLCSAGKAVWFYAGKIFAPVHLSIIYPAWTHSGSRLFDAIPCLLLLAAFGVAWKWRGQSWGRGFLFGAGAFCVTLLPVLGLVKMYYLQFAPVADHLQYAAMPALIAMAVGGVSVLAEAAGLASLAPWALGAAALGLGILSCLQSGVYRDQASLWNFAVQQNPGSSQAQIADSLALYGEGQVPEAIDHCRVAVRINPANLTAWLDLGLMLDRAHQFDESAAAYRHALAIEPRIPKAHLALGKVLLEMGSPGEAAREYEAALQLDPNYEPARESLQRVMAGNGQ